MQYLAVAGMKTRSVCRPDLLISGLKEVIIEMANTSHTQILCSRIIEYKVSVVQSLS